MVYAMMYGDIIVNVANQVRPYERERGATDAMVSTWQGRLQGFQQGKGMSRGQMRTNFDAICADFASIPVTREQKVRVGVVGEIYVKFSPLGNNNLEDFLLSEGAEPVVPRPHRFHDLQDLQPGSGRGSVRRQVDQEGCLPALYEVHRGLSEGHDPGAGALRPLPCTGHLPRPAPPGPRLSGRRQQDGEGWLLTAEMLELIHTGTPNIVCTQPFGCLPNHIVGKGGQGKDDAS